ncbi:MAG: esterase-like activity of phytase family protein, partial [Pseudomonadota bacterium]
CHAPDTATPEASVTGALALLLLGLPAKADPTAEGTPLAIAAAPVTLAPVTLASGVAISGAWQLTSEDARFGGLSALLVEDARLTALSDQGYWLSARLDRQGEALSLRGARLAPIRNAEGEPLQGNAADAEGLARVGATLVLSFERDHRLARHLGDGRIEPIGVPPAPMASNNGLEGLAGLGETRALALGEAPRDGLYPAFVYQDGHQGGALVQVPGLPVASAHSLTGADIGPDGRLYLSLRRYNPLTGVSIHAVTYAPGPDGLPDPDTRTQLAAWENDSGIDNMEAIALDRASGVLWLLSDDNYSARQRTLLVALSLP